jgi:transcriptional regulator with PAS, ATPase and Fis domain
MPPRDTQNQPTTLTALSADALQIPALELVAVDGKGKTSAAALRLTPLVVGKDDEADVVLDDPRVSRRHCSFALTERGIVLRDLGSKNGTFVAGTQILEAFVTPNTEVTVGGAKLTVRVAGAPASVPLSGSARFGDALGATLVMRALFARLEQAAATDETLLLLGESGTGKELLARAVHDKSSRRDGPFVVFDCSAVSPELAESELFGYVRGAFTGAVDDRAGVLEESHGGTLFLDEIGELPIDLQPKLLRAIEARQFRRVGSNAYEAFDTRILAATHRDLRAQVAARAFREDLYFRIAVLKVDIPPLRERRDDIGLLVDNVLRSLDPPRSADDLPPGALAMLAAHDWPGNVRELRNTVSRLLVFPHLGREAFDAAVSPPGRLPLHLNLREAREHAIAEFEEAYLSAKLREHAGNVSRAAEAIGVSRQFLHRLIARYGIRSTTR